MEDWELQYRQKLNHQKKTMLLPVPVMQQFPVLLYWGLHLRLIILFRRQAFLFRRQAFQFHLMGFDLQLYPKFEKIVNKGHIQSERSLCKQFVSVFPSQVKLTAASNYKLMLRSHPFHGVYNFGNPDTKVFVNDYDFALGY